MMRVSLSRWTRRAARCTGGWSRCAARPCRCRFRPSRRRRRRIGPAKPAAPVPVPPIRVRATPPPPPVRLNQTMLGVGSIAADPGRVREAACAAPVPAPAPVAAAAVVPVPVHDTAPVPVLRETRVPGAPDTLPANPLSELNAGDLNSFIDTTMLEGDADSAPNAGAGAPGATQMLPGAGAGPAAPAAARARLAAHPAVQRLLSLLPPSTHANVKRWGPLVGCAVAGLVIGLVLHRSPSPAPTPAAVAPPAVEAVAPPEAVAPAPEAVAPPPEAVAPPPRAEAAKPAAAPRPVAAKPAAPVAAAAAADGDCTARIVTEPDNAKVIWGGKMLGRSPIQQAAVPCGAAQVTLDRERYQTVTVDVTADARSVASVREKLHRPRGTLFVTSSPPGARVDVQSPAGGCHAQTHRGLALREAADQGHAGRLLAVEQARLPQGTRDQGGRAAGPQVALPGVTAFAVVCAAWRWWICGRTRSRSRRRRCARRWRAPRSATTSSARTRRCSALRSGSPTLARQGGGAVRPVGHDGQPDRAARCTAAPATR